MDSYQVIEATGENLFLLLAVVIAACLLASLASRRPGLAVSLAIGVLLIAVCSIDGL